MARPTASHAPTVALPPVEDIVRDESGFIWRSLRHLGVPPADLDDALQDVLVVVHRRRASFDGTCAVRTWLYGIAKRVARGRLRRAHYRRESLSGELPAQPIPPGQERAMALDDAKRVLDQLLAQLDVDKRVTFVLFELEGMSMADIAEATECPLKTAYARLYAARRHVEKNARRWQLMEGVR